MPKAHEFTRGLAYSETWRYFGVFVSKTQSDSAGSLLTGCNRRRVGQIPRHLWAARGTIITGGNHTRFERCSCKYESGEQKPVSLFEEQCLRGVDYVLHPSLRNPTRVSCGRGKHRLADHLISLKLRESHRRSTAVVLPSRSHHHRRMLPGHSSTPRGVSISLRQLH